MKNDYGTGADKISIPPTMLFSLFGDHPDVRMTATSDLKREGERLYLLAAAVRNWGPRKSPACSAKRAKQQASAVLCRPWTTLWRSAKPTPPFPLRSPLGASEPLTTVPKAAWRGLGRDVHGGRRGAMIDLDGLGLDGADTFGQLWGESLGRIVIGVEALHEAEVCKPSNSTG